MIALICYIHGFQELGWHEYSRQKDDEGRWQCPTCHADSQFVRVPDILLKTGCQHCHKPVTPPYTYSTKRMGFFCDQLCFGLYEQRVVRGLQRQGEK